MTDTVVRSEVAGVVHQVAVRPGDPVSQDQALVVVEAMKMHIPVESPRNGTVTELLVGEGDVVVEGQALVRLA